MNPDLRDELAADIAWTVQEYATVHDQTTSAFIPFNPNRVAPRVQNGILDFVANAPRNIDGYKLWLNVLASRQVGKSVTTVLALQAKTAYSPGVYSATMADTKERAETLFRAALFSQEHWDAATQMPTIKAAESRQLTFVHGGKYKTLSMGGNMVGIGRAVDNLHISEPVFTPGIAEAWNGILPAIINRAEACVIKECTPGPMHQPGAEWFKAECAASRKGIGRSRFLFEPFFGSLLNVRTWHDDWKLTKEEQKLIDKFGPKKGEPLSDYDNFTYLTLENLAFRREIMDNDSEVRRHPELFLIYYPTDPITCWQAVSGGAIPGHVLERHLLGDLVEWDKGANYMRYKEAVDPVAPHVIGVDPAGWMGGDQASFQCLEVYADAWTHVSEFSSNQIDPPTFARVIIEEAERLNHAWVICENNGVGLATLAILEMATSPTGTVLKDANGIERRYHLKNLYYHQLAGNAGNKPGIAAGAKTNIESLSALVDGLMDKITTRSAEFVDQAGSYRNDKTVQTSEAFAILNPGQMQAKRKPKHHWDRVSAFCWAAYMARRMPQRFRRVAPEALQARREELEERAKVHGYTQGEMDIMRKEQTKREKQAARRRKRGKK